MRNSILITALIAFLAGASVLAIAQSEQVKALFSSKEQVETDVEVVADVTETPANDATETAAVAEQDEPQQTVAAALADEDASVDDEAASQEPAAGDAEEATEEATEQTSDADFTVDVEAALKDRSVGRADAPIVIEDYSSLTCPHCAFFHNTIYPKLKEKYVDTGKVRWVFKGFPLNDPALRAEMVARCAPNDQYIKLTTYMYENQAKWAFAEDPLGTLNIMLRVAGVTNDVFTKCAENTELETAMVKRLEAAAEKHDINSTPTFIVDGKKVISGAGTFVGFSYDLDSILRQKGLYEEPPVPDYDADAAVPPASKAQSTFTNQ